MNHFTLHFRLTHGTNTCCTSSFSISSSPFSPTTEVSDSDLDFAEEAEARGASRQAFRNSKTACEGSFRGWTKISSGLTKPDEEKRFEREDCVISERGFHEKKKDESSTELRAFDSPFPSISPTEIGPINPISTVKMRSKSSGWIFKPFASR